MSEQRQIDLNGYRGPKGAEAARRAYLEELEFRRLMGGADYGGFDDEGGGSGERECGYRKEGGTYVEVPTSPYGKPIEHFLVCSPMLIDAAEYRLNPKGLGITLVDVPETCLTCNGSGEVSTPCKDVEGAEGYPGNVLRPCVPCKGTGSTYVTHIFDIVGQDNYPNVADFIEEARRLGVSRRCELSGGGEDVCSTCAGVGKLEEGAKTCPDCQGEGTVKLPNQYARITSRSRLFLLHRRAGLNNPAELLKAIQDAPGGAVDTAGLLELQRLYNAGCPKSLELHNELMDFLPPGCAAFYWHLLTEGAESIPERTGEAEAFKGSRYVERKLASGTYRGYSAPESFKPDYALAVFAVFPIIKLTVVDPEGRYEDRVERAEEAGVEVDVADC